MYKQHNLWISIPCKNEARF